MFRVCVFEKKDSFGLTSALRLFICPKVGGVRAPSREERKRVLGIINAVAEGV